MFSSHDEKDKVLNMNKMLRTNGIDILKSKKTFIIIFIRKSISNLFSNLIGDLKQAFFEKEGIDQNALISAGLTIG